MPVTQRRAAPKGEDAGRQETTGPPRRRYRLPFGFTQFRLFLFGVSLLVGAGICWFKEAQVFERVETDWAAYHAHCDPPEDEDVDHCVQHLIHLRTDEKSLGMLRTGLWCGLVLGTASLAMVAFVDRAFLEHNRLD